ncbi:CDP-alcohol phosphatidyltransferase family protein, partial [Zooshikella harenae]
MILNYVPISFIYFRFLLGPALLIGAFYDINDYWYVIGVSLGFLSDLFDGIIARRLGVSTDKLRSLDSWADTLFYSCLLIIAFYKYHSELMVIIIPLIILISLEV